MDLKIFENSEFGKIRTVNKNEEIWFIGKDVAEILGYSDTSYAIATHCKGVEEMSIPSNGGKQNMKIIAERDLYRLILKSKKPEAERFEDWVVGEVLPSIRKTGGYIIEKENDTPEEIMARALLVAQDTLKRREERIKSLELKIEEDVPKVEFADKLLKSKDNILIRDYSKILYDENIKIGEKKLYQWFRENKILMKNNLPYQQFMKYFFVKEKPIDTPFGVKLTTTTMINPEGQLYFYNKLNKEFKGEK
jgi:prophage antirepressor-like protein